MAHSNSSDSEDDADYHGENDDLDVQSSEHFEPNDEQGFIDAEFLEIVDKYFADINNSQHSPTSEQRSVTTHGSHSMRSDNGKGRGASNFQPATCTSPCECNREASLGAIYCNNNGCGRYLEKYLCTNDHICSDEPFHHFQCPLQSCGLRFIDLRDLLNHSVADHRYDEE
jgi:hypothetical protein